MVTLLASAAPREAFAAGPPPSKSNRDQWNRAQSVFARAKDLMTSGKYREALDGFRTSYEVVASPITRLFAARCLVALGREAEGYRELGEVVLEAAAEAERDKKYLETRDVAEQERSDLRPKIGLVTVKAVGAPEGSVLTVGGTDVPRSAWGRPFAVTPGATEVVLQDGSKTERRSVTVAAGEEKSVDLSPGASAAGEGKPAAAANAGGASSGNGLRTAAYIAGGVGVIGLATFTVAGIMAKNKFDDLEDACGGPCPPSKKGDIDSGRSTTTVANVGLAVGVIGAAAGVTLFVLSSTKSDAPVSAQVAAGPSFVGIKGSFR
jgi:hypothetical protein